jgi:hypothetical protein
MMIMDNPEHDNKWDPDDYNYCKEHDQYYKKYCCSCALDRPDNK